MATPPPGARFLTLVDVAEVLNTSSAQVYALVRGGDLPAIKIGGRGQWRVESSELEKYIQRMYEQTRDFVSTHRFGRPEDEAESNTAPQGSVEPDGDPVGGEDG
jgi:excisionase family DNA binding protein